MSKALYLLVLLPPTQTVVSVFANKECNVHHTSRKDDTDEELMCFWVFSLLLSAFFMISAMMHTEEVSPRRNSKSEKKRVINFSA